MGFLLKAASRGMFMTYYDDPELEHSPFSGPVTCDGITVSVEIYRMCIGGGGWSLEVVDDEGGSTVWDETFPTDQDAYQEFQRALEAEGLSGLLEATSGCLHKQVVCMSHRVARMRAIMKSATCARG